MKTKQILALMLLVVLISLVACAPVDDTKDTTADKSTVESDEEAEVDIGVKELDDLANLDEDLGISDEDFDFE